MPTKRDFTAIAKIFKAQLSGARGAERMALNDTIDAIGHYFAEANEGFDIERFFRACGREGS